MRFDRKSLLVVGILVVMFLLLLWVSSNMSSTNDEFNHVAKGYLFLSTGEMMIVSNPPLENIVSALPLVAINANIPANHTAYFLNNDFSGYAYQFMYNSGNDPRQITFLSRIPGILFAVLLGWMLYSFLNKHFGYGVGLTGVILYAFNPLVLGYAPIAATDFVFSGLFFITCLAMYDYFRNPNIKRALSVGFLFGLTLGSKSTGLFLLPLYGLFLLYETAFQRKNASSRINLVRMQIPHAIAMGIVMLLIINILYGFQGSFTPLGKSMDQEESLYFDKTVYNSNALPGGGILNRVPLFMPYPFLKDIITAFKISEDWNGGYLFGEYRKEGFWYYFPVVMFFKNPVFLWILLVAGVISLLRHGKYTRELVYLSIAPLFILLIFTHQRFNIGVKYVLPVVFFVICLAACSYVWVRDAKRKRWALYGVIGGITLAIVPMLIVLPYALGYANLLAGGPAHAHKIMTNANIAWGQDVKTLGEYVQEDHIENISIALYAIEDPSSYGITYTPLTHFGSTLKDGKKYMECSPVNGYVAISVTYLQGDAIDNPECFAWLRDKTPIARAGTSILIYDITN